MEKLENNNYIPSENLTNINYEEIKILNQEEINNSVTKESRLNLDELEDMISKGIDPPGIELIDDMPKENKETVVDFSAIKKIKKPWEC
jgi:hypothetical protein